MFQRLVRLVVIFRTICTCTTLSQKMDNVKKDLRNIFLRSVNSVKPNNLVRNSIAVRDTLLEVRDVSYVLNKNCFMVGFGKAVLGMATEAEKILGEHLVTGAVSVPQGILTALKNNEDMLPGPGSILQLYEGAANNLPDVDSQRAAMVIKELAESVGENGVLLVMVSGGGSALLPLPRPPVTLEEKCLVIRLLASAGADITELNCVRKKLSLLKGGGLARAAYPARVVSLILSDVIGDPLDFIASGPTVFNSDAPTAAINIIHKYSLADKVPLSVIHSLNESVKEPSKINDFSHVQNEIIGNNAIAVESAKLEARKCGYFPVVLSTRIQGLVGDVGQMYADLAAEVCKHASGEANNLSSLVRSLSVKYKFFGTVESEIMSGVENVISGWGLCLIAGGETTVLVQGKGVGGRNQELALWFAVFLHGLERVNQCMASFDVALLSCGTDGIDGPTNAAGAIGYSAQCTDNKLKPSYYLSNNDSHNFYLNFRSGSDLVLTGHTGTNVMDVHVLIVKKREGL